MQTKTVRTVVIALLLLGALGVSIRSSAQILPPNPNAPIPLPLSAIPVPRPSNLADYVADEQAAIQLGKALFWDMQTGSDGVQACASCHFHAGADDRMKNQLNPGANGLFNVAAPNATVTGANFPFHRFQIADDAASPVTYEADDIMSSQGVFRTSFGDVIPGSMVDQCTAVPDPVWNVGGKNVRRVPGRNTPTAINAIFNFRSFWDGRASFFFNGVNPVGVRDPDARVLRVEADGSVLPVAVLIDNASAASQAVGPPLSPMEMSCEGRTFAKLGKKLLSLRPLGRQLVDPTDSVLGPLAASAVTPGARGLTASYADLIQQAFQPQWWDTDQIVTYPAGAPVILPAPGRPLSTSEFTVMEANFSLFWGLAIQLYESTLVSDDSPFDRFVRGTGGLTLEQQQGLDLFVGKCVGCHAGPLFSAATTGALGVTMGDTEVERPIDRMAMALDAALSTLDFTRPAIGAPAQALLDFDPRGALIQITQGTCTDPAIFAGTLGGTPGSCDVVPPLFQLLPATGAFSIDPNALAITSFSVAPGCLQTFAIDLQLLPLGTYTLCVDGTARGAINMLPVVGGTEGGVSFATSLGTIPGLVPSPLTFDPRGKLLEVTQGAACSDPVAFSDFFPGWPIECDPAFPVSSVYLFNATALLPQTGIVPVGDLATATATLDVQTDCSATFLLSLANVASGTYTLCVDGTSVGSLPILGPIAFYDSGFYNIGVRPTVADLGIGGEAAGPIAFSRRVQLGLPVPELTGLFAPPLIGPTDRLAVNGSFKTPGLRNIELTAPYMHNGGMLTLSQVVEFYTRGADFFEANLQDLDPDMGGIGTLKGKPGRRQAIVEFLKSLTDERVRYEDPPFDHPQLFVPNGHPTTTGGNVIDDGTGKAADTFRELPATGGRGNCAPIDGVGAQRSCDDGNYCTTEFCDTRRGCIYTNNTLPCDDFNACTTADACRNGSCGGTAVDCNDGNPCTTDTCDPMTGCRHVNNTASCDDANACTTNDTCNGSGACVGGPAPNCDDGNPCTDDYCDPDSGCEHRANTNACNDGNACTQADTCHAGVCVGANPVVCTASDQCHVAGTCDPASGMCSNPTKANGSTCTDGNACTQADTCQAGACVGANPVVCTASDQCHVAGTCDPASGMCSNPAKANGSTCTDGNACTQADTCQAGACVGANPVVCTASDQCHVAGTCNTATGVCSNPAKANGSTCTDGNACTQADTCQAGACVGSNPVVCTASDQCHVAGTCNPASGVCSNPPRVDGSTCTDGNACTQADTCQAGACVGANPVSCTALDQCHTAGTCDTATGFCSSPTKANGSTCSDGNACTQADTCQAGACVGANPVVCTASDQCHTAGTCNTATGVCSNPTKTSGTSCNDGNACTTGDACNAAGACTGAAASCDDGNPCTDDTCDPVAGCRHTNNTASCNDGNACTQADTCQAGTCVGSNPVTCTASDQCHVAGTCDPASGFCSNPAKANGSSCTDGNACTQADTCQAGACVGSNPVVCTAYNECHLAGTCDPATGVCSDVHKPTGTACSDGNACTTGDACNAGGDCISGSAASCDDGNPCTDDTCDPLAGCRHTNNAASCNDGNACTQSDTCQAGTCVGSNPVTCTASDQCHVAGTCDPASGMCSNPAKANGSVCTDGNACTQSDTCQAGACVGSNPVVCTASDQCHTAGTCDPASGSCSNPTKTNGASCNDGNACTTTDTCQGGTCTGGAAPSCDDGNPCTDDTCDPVAGCRHTNNTASCNDGNACTQSDTCQAGACVGSNPVVCTASDQCHVAGACDPTSGMCSNPAKANGSACTDGNACTQADACQAGACVGANPVVCTASDQCHVAGTCNPASGTCSNPTRADGASCDDGNACTATDTCVAGTCTGGAGPNCDDGNPCTDDTCDPTGGCHHTNNTAACNDGNACTRSDTCQAGTCVGSDPVVCTASDQCHDAGTCDPASGACSNPARTNGTSCDDGNACTTTDTCVAGACTGGAAPSCDDGNPCTDDTCDPTGGCHHSDNTASCNDGDACTQSDTCQAGTCVGSNPIVCTASDQCHDAGTCDPASGICSSPARADGASCDDGNACTTTDICVAGTCTGGGAAPSCDDGNPCTDDTCNPGSGCQHADNTASCNDGNACTQSDTCQAGACVGANPVVCTASDQCHDPGTCDPATGVCSDPASADGASCDDGDACTTTDICVAGTCTGGAAPSCDDGNPCTDDTCNPGSGCQHADNTASCDDGDACTQSDTCQAGACVGANPVVCTASDQCHDVGVCDPASGICSNPARDDGASCDDGNACTTTDTCQAGACTGGAAPSCDDGNPCTDDVCDPAGGCQHPDNTASCDDGDACTQSDTCQAGTCVGSNPVVCAAPDACHTAGTCDPATGTCPAGPAISCDDGDACTIDSCNPDQGCVSAPATGFDSLICLFEGDALHPPVCQPLTTGLEQRIRKVGTLIQTAADATSTADARRYLHKASRKVRQLKRIARQMLRRHELSDGCADALLASLDETHDRMKVVARGLTHRSTAVATTN